MKVVVLILAAATAAAAQEEALQAIVSESARLKHFSPEPGSNGVTALTEARRASDGLQAMLRDWTESLLPKSRAALGPELPSVKAKLDADLYRTGLLARGKDQISEPGLPNPVRLQRPADAPDLLFVTWGVGVPCGEYDAVYAYDYSQGAPRRVLETHGTDGAETVSDVLVSQPDVYGARSILTLRYAVQCGSNWNALSYDLFRLPSAAGAAVSILSGRNEYFSYDYQVRLDPSALLLEMDGHMMDVGILVRKHVLHFATDGPAPRRIDPVALQPQDFVDEWLRRPWPEMARWSAEESSDKLKKWHDFLSGDADEYISGEFAFAQACKEKPGMWQVAIELDWVRDKEIREPLTVYFMVRQSEQYRFQMAGVSFGPQEDCPGETPLIDTNPSLFPKHAAVSPPRREGHGGRRGEDQEFLCATSVLLRSSAVRIQENRQ